MSLSIGQPAPDFTLVQLTSEGPQLFQLSKHIGKGNLLLLFVPMAFTGVCTQELCEISNQLNEFQALNAQVYAISGDNPFAQEAWAKKENITLPLLSDYEHEVAKSYGVAYDAFLPEKNLIMGGVPKRSAFVIDAQGVIRYAEVQDHPKDLPDFDAIKAVLGTLA